MWVNLINLAKQQIIVKALSFTKNKLCKSKEIKKALSQTPSLPIYNKAPTIYLKQATRAWW